MLDDRIEFLKDGGLRNDKVATENGGFSPKGFSQAAEAFGYRFTDFSIDAPVDDGAEPVFEGTVGIQSLPCGLNLWLSDLQSLRDSTLESVAEPSVTVAMMLGAHAAECEIGSGDCLYIPKGAAAVISTADDIHVASRYKAGQRAQCLLVSARPEDFADDEVTEQIRSVLKSTAVRPLAITHRIRLLVNELTAPSAHGGVGRLLTESAALELMARSLLVASAGPAPSHGRLVGKDYAKVLIVRDMIETSPSTDFTLSALAREAGLSASVLKAKFPLAFGQSVFEFLRDVRLGRARQGIEEEGWTVSEAAYFAGYKHRSNFAMAFRRKFGVAPSALKRSN